MPKDFAGNTFLSARSLPVGVKVRDWVGRKDRDDYYKVTIGSRGSFNLTVNSKKAAAGARLIDSNGQTVGIATRFGKKSRVLSNTLEAGTYYIHVSGRKGMTPYSLQTIAPSSSGQVPISASKPVPEPGLSPLSAFDVGALSGQRAYQDSIDSVDRADFYRFTLNQVSDFAASAGGLADNIDLNLYYDRNADGVADGNERITSDIFGQAGRDASIKQTLGAGTYFLSVESGTTPYTLRLSSSPVADINPLEPGDTPTTAYQFGILNGSVPVKDFVGTVDPVDVYAFTLNTTRDVFATMSGTSYPLPISFIQDTNNNGIIDFADKFLGGNSSGASATLLAGNYFIRVQVKQDYLGKYSHTENTAYTLTIR